MDMKTYTNINLVDELQNTLEAGGCSETWATILLIDNLIACVLQLQVFWLANYYNFNNSHWKWIFNQSPVSGNIV